MPIYGVPAPPVAAGKTLEELRAELAREADMYFTGVADSGSTSTLVDAEGLKHYPQNDVLIGGVMVTVSGPTGFTAGEWRFVADYDASTWTIALEYILNYAIVAGVTYELYLAPRIGLDQWDDCINKAIREAWPEVWNRRLYTIEATEETDTYYLPGDEGIEEVIEVDAVPIGDLDHWPAQRLIKEMDWTTYGQPGYASGPVELRLRRPITVGDMGLAVYVRHRYPELLAGQTTYLDVPYIMAAAKANLYSVLADNTHGEAGEAAFLQRLNYWRGQAAERKQGLAAQLLGVPLVGMKR